jgi:dihydrofolate synthase/folylpolyglutamate synthase
MDAAVERIGATFFEATTAMAFDLFAREGVDAAVIETGLGGRLDSTNVVHRWSLVSRPSASITSSISGRHARRSQAEKAGIFKAGVPAVIGERDDAIRALLADLAAARGSTPILDVVSRAGPDEVAVTGTGRCSR